MKQPVPALLTVLCLSFGGVGCSSDAEPESEPAKQEDPTCEAPGIIDPTLLIDDMEDGDGLIATVGIRNGGWWVSSDGTGTVTPPAEQAPVAERILGGRCNSKYAMRLTGSGFSEWGAVISATFRFTDDIQPYDASGYRGITFYARVGPDNNSVVHAQFQDSSSHLLGGACNPISGTPDECYNGFGADLSSISTEWQKFTLEFATLTQRPGWGYQADAVNPAAVYDLEWNLDANRTFDVWVDDIWFFE
jgi:hypothetical protein